MLLAEDLRTAMGVRLEGNIVVFDEAHNLVEVSALPFCPRLVLMIAYHLEWFPPSLTGYKPHTLGKYESNGDQNGCKSGSDIFH